MAMEDKIRELDERMEEFEQLRKDHVTVRTGSLSWKLLVDVLMGDLMETAA